MLHRASLESGEHAEAAQSFCLCGSFLTSRGMARGALIALTIGSIDIGVAWLANGRGGWASTG